MKTFFKIKQASIITLLAIGITYSAAGFTQSNSSGPPPDDSFVSQPQPTSSSGPIEPMARPASEMWSGSPSRQSPSGATEVVSNIPPPPPKPDAPGNWGLSRE